MMWDATEEAFSVPVDEILACHECDLLQRAVPLPLRGTARCVRCGAMLYRNLPQSLDRTLALTVAATILFVLANVFPIVGLNTQGIQTSTTLFGAVLVLQRQDMGSVAALVFVTTLLMPALQIAATLCMLLPLKLGRTPRWLPAMFRLTGAVRPWGMVEVFLLGTLVSLAKLAHMATLVPDVALWAFAGLMLLLAAADSSFDPRILWQRSPAKVAP